MWAMNDDIRAVSALITILGSLAVVMAARVAGQFELRSDRAEQDA